MNNIQDKIKESINHRLGLANVILNQNLQAVFNGDEIVLKGETHFAQNSQLAEKMIKEISGSHAVVNRTQIKP
ncbi:BON domain-containing protein [Marinicella sp. S1101]|uniref:BON domain-containing protein n=1 Tax=Marinicella marina TaxID=2996016 RepID=UPI0022609B2A|nr:BON domain-containing protein [Marinicella marina]MCX7552508.1 BON domain-containing protein [Marinicella marina]MDJ1139384.1 BON domain-containing protein [Marinicella marina]